VSLQRLPASRRRTGRGLDDVCRGRGPGDEGNAEVYQSSEHGRRHFCADCGTGLFYVNASILPGIIDIQSATYDDPNAVPAMVHIQTAERLRWMERAHELPSFERYPPQS
jgi:hypothetical protein